MPPPERFQPWKKLKIDPAKVEFFDHIQKIGTPNPSERMRRGLKRSVFGKGLVDDTGFALSNFYCL